MKNFQTGVLLFFGFIIGNAVLLVESIPPPWKPIPPKAALNAKASSKQQEKETQALIRGGIIVETREFPYVVEINKRSDSNRWIPQCTGTLLSSKWVLSSFSCTKDITNGAQVVAGRNSKKSLSMQVADVETTYGQELYNPTNGSGYDIVLLKLKSPISFTPLIQPANLTSSPRIDFIGQMVGWGKSCEYCWVNSSESQNLLKLNVSLYEAEECKAVFNTTINSREFCAISPSGTTACKLDAGGPMVSNGEVIGVLSRTSDDCTTTPSIYVKVYPYINPISSLAGINANGTDSAPNNQVQGL